MPFLGRHQIDPELRARHDNQHRAKLKEALLSPHLTDEQRAKIQQQLQPAGAVIVLQEKSLTQDSVGTIEVPTQAELAKLKKKELVALAEQLGLPTTGDRNQLLDRISGRG